MTNAKTTKTAAAKNTVESVELRKDFVACWTHANPTDCREKVSSLYDLLVTNWPGITRGGHRGLVGRVKPWDTVVHSCPCCGLEAQGLTSISEVFGLRFYKARGKTYLQSWCRSCRAEKAAKGDKVRGNGNVRVNPEVRVAFTN